MSNIPGRFRRTSLLLLLACSSISFVFAQNFQTTGTAVWLGDDTYELVNGYTQVGAIWSNQKISLNDPFDFTFYLTSEDPSLPGGTSAPDGMAFVLQNTGQAAMGGVNEGLGYGAIVNPPISPSLAVEVDTWGNCAGPVQDICAGPFAGAHHLAIHQNGVMNPALFAPVVAMAGAPFGVPGGGCRRLRVKWEPSTNSLWVWYNNVQKYAVTHDIINTTFSGQDSVWFGFTAAVGGFAPNDGRHIVSWKSVEILQVDTVVCLGQPINLSSTPGNNPVWTELGGNGGLSCANCPNPVFNPVTFQPSYTYVLEDTNVEGCLIRDTLTILVDTLSPASFAGDTLFACGVDSVLLSGSNPSPGMGLWSVVSGNAVFADPNAPGTWATQLNQGDNVLQWVVSNGVCPADTDEVLITVDLVSVSADAGGPYLVCDADSVQLAAYGMGWWENWTGTGIFANPGDSASWFLNIGPSSTDTIIWHLVGSACPDSTDTTVVVTSPLPTQADAGADQNYCLGQVPNLSGVFPPGSVGNGIWSQVSGPVATIANPGLPNSQVTFTTPGPYVFGWTVSSGVCPDSYDEVTLNVFGNPIVDAGPDSILTCTGRPLPLVGTGPGLLPTWSPPAGFVDPNLSNATFIPSISQYVYFYDQDINGCSATDSIYISVVPGADVNIFDSDFTLCEEDTLNLLGIINNADLWWWSSNSYMSDTLSLTPEIRPLYGLNTYYLTGLDTATQCSFTDSLTITVLDVRINGLPDSLTVCRNESFLLNPIVITLADSIRWTTGGGVTADSLTIQNPNFLASSDGFAVFSVWLGNCSNQDTVWIRVQQITINAEADRDELNLAQEIELTSSVSTLIPASISYFWTGPGYFQCDTCQNTTASNMGNTGGILASGTNNILLIITDRDNGCVDTMIVVTSSDSLIVPNVLTPNGDGINDVLDINYLGVMSYSVMIFDRWGTMVFETTNPLEKWNGKRFNTGSECEVGVYFLVIEIDNDDPARHHIRPNKLTHKGGVKPIPITLLR